MKHKIKVGKLCDLQESQAGAGKNRYISGLNFRQMAALLLMFVAVPVWSAGLQVPSIHQLAPVRRSTHPRIPLAKPVIVGATYRLAPACTNPLHALSVTVHIRDEGGPLRNGQARVQISDLSRQPSTIWNADSAASLIPAMASGQAYTTRQWVGALPQYRKALPGRHTLLVEVVPQNTDRSVAPKPIPRSMYRLLVKIPAGYCQTTLRPATKGAVVGKPLIGHRQPNYPPSPCVTPDCVAGGRNVGKAVAKSNYRLKPCNTPACLAARLKAEKGSNVAKFGSALKPDLHVVSVKVSPQRSTSGTPIMVTAVIQNKGAVASKAGTILNIYCSVYEGANMPPTRWTCKVYAPHKSAGGMPMWDIPLPAIPGHGQADVALRIQEHWADGMYYFLYTKPGKVATVQDLVNAKGNDDMIIEIDKK